MATIEIELSPRSCGRPLVLHFELENHRMAQKYVELISSFQIRDARIDCLNSYWNFHLDTERIGELTEELQRRIDELESEPEISMPFRVNASVTQDELNAIHVEFEKYLNLVNHQKLIPCNWQAATESLLQINLLIHKIENHRLLRRAVDEGKRHTISCNFGFRYENDEFRQLEAADFDFFTSGSEFGDLFCGYNTTGKNFVHCYHDGDVELVKSGGVRPQRTYSTEAFVYFGPRASGEEFLTNLARWWDQNELSKYGYRFDDPQNAYGLVRIGRLIEPPEFKGRSHWEKLTFLDQFEGVKECRLIER